MAGKLFRFAVAIPARLADVKKLGATWYDPCTATNCPPFTEYDAVTFRVDASPVRRRSSVLRFAKLPMLA
jgi:hypothetical protein